MLELRRGKSARARGAVRTGHRHSGLAVAFRIQPEAVDLAELPHEEAPEEPYRPELVARLERAVREGTYRPEARAIADAIIRRIDSMM